MITIVWATDARLQYFKVLEYLYEEWGELVALDFEELILINEAQIKSGIVRYPFSISLGFEKCVIDKYNSLIFKRTNELIEVVALIDNRSNHPYY